MEFMEFMEFMKPVFHLVSTWNSSVLNFMVPLFCSTQSSLVILPLAIFIVQSD